MPNLLAIIPAYNEAVHITATVHAVQAHLPVVVIDDGSRDDTARLAEDAGAQVMRQIPNQGKGAALRLGFRHALQRGCDAVITLDGDGQHAPGDLPAFLAAFDAQGADLIIGRRDFSHMPWQRRLANTIGRWSFSWAVGRPIPDNQSGYRLISRRLMELLLDSDEQGFEFEVEMITACLKHGFDLAWVPIRTIYADEVSSIQPWKHTVNFFRIVWAARKKMQE